MENKEEKNINKEKVINSVKAEDKPKSNENSAGGRASFVKGKKNNFRKGGKGRRREKPEFEQKLVDLSRVNRVTKAGKQLAFRALVVLGNRKGKVGFGVEKGSDVTIAISKAVNQAKKKMVQINMVNGTIPHEVRHKFKSANVMIKPAPKGTGVKAGGVVQTVLDLAGVQNVVAKIMGSSNKINNVHCAYDALASLKTPKKNKQEVNNKKEKSIEVKKDEK